MFKSFRSTARALLALAAIGAASVVSAAAFDQSKLPGAVQVPAGHAVSHVVSTSDGQITYECKKAEDKLAWVFVGPRALLVDEKSNVIGRYFGPPATWESQDGSHFTGKQLATAPAGEGNIPIQLVQATPSGVPGVFQSATYVQRVNLVGGVAPASACDTEGKREVVTYKADYIIYKAAK